MGNADSQFETQSCLGRLIQQDKTNIRNLKKSHLPMTWCQGRGTCPLTCLEPLMRGPSCPRRKPVLTATTEVVLNRVHGRTELAMRVTQTGVHLPGCTRSDLIFATWSFHILTDPQPAVVPQTHTQDPNLTMHVSSRSPSWVLTCTRLPVWQMPEAVDKDKEDPTPHPVETPRRSHWGAQPGADGV